MSRSSPVAIIFLVIGLGLLTGCGLAYAHQRDFLDRAVPVQGTVLRASSHRDEDGGTMWSKVWGYTYEGVAYQDTSNVSSSSQPTIGQSGDLLVDPSNPGSSTEDGFVDTWLLTTMLGGFGAIFTLIGGGVVVGWIVGRSARRRDEDRSAELDRTAPLGIPGAAPLVTAAPPAGTTDPRGPFL